MRKELKRRSIIKAVLWRFIGILWTWVGSYLIILFIPPRYKTAALIATFIVIYHHSTRMIMYYFYERIWASVSWGRTDDVKTMTKGEIAAWSVGIIISLAIAFFLIIYVTPIVKGK